MGAGTHLPCPLPSPAPSPPLPSPADHISKNHFILICFNFPTPKMEDWDFFFFSLEANDIHFKLIFWLYFNILLLSAFGTDGH